MRVCKRVEPIKKERKIFMKYGVGIDVSKGKSTISMLSIAGEVIEEPFEINHDLNGLSI